MELNYSFKLEDESKIAKAIGRDLNIPFKPTVVICDRIRGLRVKEAKKLLQAVISLKRSIPFHRFTTGVGHRKGDEGIGKYPKKACQEILTLLKNLETNFEYKGLDSEKLKIIHIQALRGISRRRRKPKGRYKLWKTQLVNIQVMAKEY